jgi:hypothetical protein
MTFWTAVLCGKRLKLWNTNPTLWRKRAIWGFCRPRGTAPSIRAGPMRITPPFGASRQARQRSRVVLPEPLGPITAVTSPSSTEKSTPRSTAWLA